MASERAQKPHPGGTDVARVAIRNLSKSFGTKTVLRDVSFDVAKNRSLVIIGSSGVGKSVLLKVILGIVQPDSGVIEIDGVNVLANQREGDRARRRIGMLFQGGALFDSMKVWENIGFRLIHGDGKSRKTAREHAMHCLSRVGLGAEVGELYPSEISGGMQKRVGLARAIAASPEILFFDEPTTGLDPIMADVINNLIIEQVRALGATAISITHDITSARKIGDEIAMLHDGRIVWQGSAQAMENSGNAMVDQFIHGRAEGPIKVEQ